MLILTDQEKKVAVFIIVVVSAGASLQLGMKMCPAMARVARIIDNPVFYPKVNVNAATPAELESVPHIGPTGAQRIVAARSSGGRFRDLNDLARAGIGPAALARIGKYLVFQ